MSSSSVIPKPAITQELSGAVYRVRWGALLGHIPLRPSRIQRRSAQRTSQSYPSSPFLSIYKTSTRPLDAQTLMPPM